jgi:hypothetical protein
MDTSHETKIVSFLGPAALSFLSACSEMQITTSMLESLKEVRFTLSA